MNRRTALRTFAALPLLATARGVAASPPTSRLPSAPFTIGIATVTLKSLPLDNMVAAVKRLGVDAISLHRAHSPWENQPGQWKEIAEKIRTAGVTPKCCGVLYLKNDEKEMRRMMEYVRAHGLAFFSCSPEPASLPLLEKMLREYDFRAAIHNHGPEDKSWPSVARLMERIADADPRIGLCLDVGHAYRSGENPLELIHQHAKRLYDVHLKDSLAAVGQTADVPVEMGRGKLDLRHILTALIEAGYPENVWLEYEKDPSDPVPGLAESLGYVRGLLG
jgi:inosose dehydratase